MKKTTKKSPKQTKIQKITNWKKHHRKAFILLMALAIWLILWLIWHKPMTDMFDDIFGISSPAKSQRSSEGLSLGELPTIDDGSQAADDTSQSGGTGTGTSSTSSKPGSSGGSTSTTTNNTYTSTTNSGSTGGGSGGSAGGSVTASTDQARLIGVYGNIVNGLSLDQIVSLGIGQPSCLVSVVLLGEQKVCTWTEGNATVIVTLLNDHVVAKVKLGF